MLKVLHIYVESAYYLDQFYAGSAGDFKHWTWDPRTGTQGPGPIDPGPKAPGPEDQRPKHQTLEET